MIEFNTLALYIVLLLGGVPALLGLLNLYLRWNEYFESPREVYRKLNEEGWTSWFTAFIYCIFLFGMLCLGPAVYFIYERQVFLAALMVLIYIVLVTNVLFGRTQNTDYV